MSAILARLAARYLAGFLVAYGLIDHETGQQIALDPDVALALGMVLAAGAEGFYALAKRFGWDT